MIPKTTSDKIVTFAGIFMLLTSFSLYADVNCTRLVYKDKNELMAESEYEKSELSRFKVVFMSYKTIESKECWDNIFITQGLETKLFFSDRKIYAYDYPIQINDEVCKLRYLHAYNIAENSQYGRNEIKKAYYYTIDSNYDGCDFVKIERPNKITFPKNIVTFIKEVPDKTALFLMDEAHKVSDAFFYPSNLNGEDYRFYEIDIMTQRISNRTYYEYGFKRKDGYGDKYKILVDWDDNGEVIVIDSYKIVH